MGFIFLSLFIYFIASVVQIFLTSKKKLVFLSVMNMFAALVLMVPIVGSLFFGQTFEYQHSLNILTGDFLYKLDGLSAFFAFIIAIAGSLGTFYAKGYLKPYIEQGKSISAHLFFFNIFLISMLSVILSENIIFFLISWEIMSLTSFFLMIFENEKKEVRTIGINYLIKMHICVVLLLVGFILLNIKTGVFDFASFGGQINDLIFVILFLGFGLKAGIVPLHTWLPKAHPVAPTHVSALMSGVMIKTGIYGILRLLTYYQPDLRVSYFVLIIGVLSAFFGILYSIAQRNYKKMLAYSSIENIGIIVIALAVGMLGDCYGNNVMKLLGYAGCFMHILNHSIFKSLLFMAVGVLYNKLHTKDMEKLGGLVKKMPVLAGLFLVGAVAISAIPPLNGFVSEFLIYLGFLNSFKTNSYFLIPVMIITAAILAFVGTMALISFTNAFSIIFLGSPRSEAVHHADGKISKSLVSPMIILVLAILFIGFLPQYAIMIVKAPMNIIANAFIAPVELLTNLSKFNLIFVSLVVLVFVFRYMLLKNKNIEYGATWGCGYDRPSAKMQYSANSFTRPFLGFLTPFYVRELSFKQIKELFPEKTAFKSSIKDIFQVYCIEPIVNISDLLLRKMHCIQSANTQIYLLYGVIFLMIALICLLGGKL